MDGMLLHAPGNDGLVDYDQLKNTLRDIQNADPKSINIVLQNLPTSTGDKFLDAKLESLKYLASPMGNVTSDGDGNMTDVIREIQEYIEGKASEQSEQPVQATAFNWTKYAGAESSPAARKKKKTKANPFRVLMGMVGKLLDHGVPKPTVVRHIAKNTKFDERTIDRAVDIVRDYNRKKEREDPEQELDMTEGQQPEEHKAIEANFNYNRDVLAQRAEIRADVRSLYDAEPQWEKRSTAELFARLQWLDALMDYSPSTRQGDQRKAADKQGANGQMQKITTELRQRGFSQNEVDALLTRRGI